MAWPQIVHTMALVSCMGLRDVAAPPSDAPPQHVPIVLARDLQLIDRELHLDPSQRAIVEALLEEVDAAGSTVEASRAFMENLGAVLRESQRAKLASVQRAIDRERMESSVQVAGENVDLGAIAFAYMRGESSDKLDAAIAAYRKELDPMLDERAALAAKSDEQQRRNAVGIAIRDLNRVAADRIAAAISSGFAADFQREVLAKGYPTAYAPLMSLEAIRRFAKESSSDVLASIEAEGATRVGVARARAVEAIRARDDARFAGDSAREAAAAAIASAERLYDEIDAWAYAAAIKAATPEQLASCEAGRAIADRAKAAADNGPRAWDNQAETIKRFDANGDGELDGDESSKLLETFARSVGRTSRRKL